MCETLDKRFKKDGIRDLVKFNLSDNSDGGIGTHKYLEACANGLKNVADVLNSHTYIFGYETPNSVIYDWEKENVELSKASGKPHVVGEFGGNQCVGAARQKDINLYERGVLMVRLATNFLNAGASAISYWSLIDQYYDKDASYDNMQQLGLWKHVKGVYANDTIYKDLKTDYEVRPQYYAYSLLSRFVRPGAKVYPVDTRDDFYAATAVKNSDGKWTYIFSNGSSEDKKVNLSNSFDSSDKPLKAYVYAKDKLPKDDSQIMPSEELSVTSADISLTIPAQSVILLSE
jgi:alpha-galactosidase